MKMTKESLLKVIGAVDDVISALAGTNDEVHKDETDKMVRLWDDLNDQYAPPEVVRELARMALAAMDSEPVAWTWHYREQWHVTNDKCRAEFVATDGDVAVLPLYRHAQPAPISEQVLPLQDKVLQGVIDALEHPAGINAAGKQVVRHALVELQERRKADSEPVILYRQVNPANGMKTYWAELDPEEFRHLKQHTDENAEFMTLYRHTQPAPERDQVRIAHAEWSQATFGNVGPVGPLKHLSKEALEAAEQPGDLSEWADMQFLLWDAQRRAGVTDEQITQAMIDKLAVNKQRKWPEPKDGEPRLHIKEQPAPVVPDSYVMVPMRLTAENGAKGALSGEFSETKFVNCPECFGADECETCDGSGRIEITVPVTWTTIKEIWAKGVEHFSATPREVKSE